MSNNQVFSEFAPQLYDLGYSPIPLSGKTARIKEWPKLFCDQRPKREQIGGGYARARRGRHVMNGIGLATHNGLMFIDIDADGPQHDEVYDMIKDVVPAINRAPKIIGKRGAKYLLRLIDKTETTDLNLVGSHTDGRVELLVHRRLGVVPPTVHPDTGRPYSFDPDAGRQRMCGTHLNELVTIKLAELKELRALFETRPQLPRQAEAVSERVRTQRESEAAQKKWNGSELEMRRVARALKHLDPSSEDIWWKVGAALKNWTGDHPDARQLFDAWSGGGSLMEIELPGAPDKFNKSKTQDEAWSQERTSIGVGTIIHLAQQQGFDATLRQWPALKSTRAQAETNNIQDSNSPFELAAKRLPWDNVDFFSSLEALRTRALNDRNISKSDIRLLDQILQYVNQKYGYAWPSYERLSETIGISEKQLYKHATNLERAGYIIRAQNNLNPDGSKRTAFAILPPQDMTWRQLLERHRQKFGHGSSVGQDHTESFETTRGQGNTALSQFAKSNQTGGATQPGSTAGKLDEAGQAGPVITNRQSSSGGGCVVESLTTKRAGPSIRSINDLVSVGLLENEDLINLMKVCSSDQIGAGVVQSVLLMLESASRGVDGGQEANSEIAVGDQLVRRAVDKAVSSTFDPFRENDRRSKRIDLDLTGGKASRTCLKMFRDKLEIELGKSGYETASYRQRKAAWTT